MRQIIFFLFLFIGVAVSSHAQDSVVAVKPAAADTAFTKKDSVKPKPEHSPRKATIRSAIIPGWGQAYNKKYWKIPIVYGALGTAAGFFIYNRKEYTDARDAYRNMMDGDPSNNNLIKPRFQPVDPEAVRQYRIAVRQYVDYSVLAFIILWGLNVVDATVDGHLKAFEVNDNLSLHINPSYSPQTRQANVGLVLKLGK
ncbi:hypothetical protein IQ13_3819 [Lacibacter cauensis]|uniref:DUF5683 domain-containing protein n=1 Tax=Lacibacter cauensis TaxID=510947 RepID=A0A562SDQ3_9BACT|nr:DUF5683 domain-containing protein [Lacibacter cauensis]TWI79415.1 hypothetical protein IQ13_3819 [Lacibacter cauensis]